MGAPLGPHERILVRLPSWLGDLVMAEPALRALVDERRARGTAERVSITAPAHLLTLLGGSFPELRRLPLAARSAASARDQRGHDTALLFSGSFRSAWTAWRAGIPRRVGWARDARGVLLTDRAAPALERGATPLGIGRPGGGRRVLPRPFGASCAELLGLVGVAVRDPRPRLQVEPSADEAVARRLWDELRTDPDEPFVLVNVGARKGSAKGWEPWAWAAVLERLPAAVGRPAVLVCGPGEEEALRAVRAALPGRPPPALVDPVARLPELAALCRRAALVLTADSGPRHVAAAVGAPVVCVAGPTDPRHTADHTERTALVRVEVPCGPCHRERCPLSGAQAHACMARIDPERVIAAARSLLYHDGSPAPLRE